jgi:hypothetical protein
MILPLGGVKDELDAAILELGAGKAEAAPAPTATRSGAAAGG